MASMKNAIAVDMATCGGTNSVAHMQAYAHEAQIPLTMKDWDAVSRKVPALCNVALTGLMSCMITTWSAGRPRS